MSHVLLIAEQAGRTNSGMGVYTYEVIRRLTPELMSNGIVPTVVVREDAQELLSDMKSLGAEVIVLTSSSTAKWRRMWELARLSGNQKYDLVYSTDLKIPKPLRHIPFVPTIHDLCGLECPGEFGLAKKLYIGRLNQPVMRRAAKIIAISEQTSQCIQKFYGIDETMIEVIYNGFNPVSREQNYPWPDGVPHGTPFFLFPGRISPRKNFQLILNALKLLLERGVDCHLVHAGPPGWANQEDYTRLKSLGLESQYFELGYVSSDQLHALYAHAAALVYPSLCEGFGLPILEALSAGCPAIVAAGTASEEIGKEFVEIVSPEDAAQLASKIEQAIEQPHPIKSNKDALKAHLAGFSWDKTSTEISSLLMQKLV